MSLPIPDVKTVSGFKKYFTEYVIIALAGAVVWLFVAFINLNNYVRTDLLQRQIRNEAALEAATRTTESFLNYQRFVIPVRQIPEPLPLPPALQMPAPDTLK